MISVDPRQIEQARLSLRGMVQDYLLNPEYSINLIDFGFPRRTVPVTRRRYWDVESVSLRFHVTKKYTLDELEALKLKVLPRRIGQFETDVIEAEYSVPLLMEVPSGPRTAPRARLCGGLGISAFADIHGTLGGIVRDRQTGAPMILSNWHVLYATRNARTGQPIYQPILRSGKPQTAIVARATRERLSAPATGSLSLDVAVAALTDARPERWENLQLEIGGVTGVARARLGTQVVKSGLTSGRTYGVVTGIEGFGKMTYQGNWLRLIERIVTISRYPLDRSTALVSMPGDSGAWWLDAATRQAIAVHYAGLRDGSRAQGMDMQAVLDALEVDLA
jgi:endonuclease G